jgi:hypothetical protein
MKKLTRHFLIGGLIVALVGILVWQKISPSFGGERSGPPVTLYWGNTCPHCHTLMDGDIYKQAISKLNLTTKEVWQNAKNSDDMRANIANCNLDPNGAGVPLLYVSTTQSCYLGVPQIEQTLTNIMSDNYPPPDIQVASPSTQASPSTTSP